jgi:ribosome-associated protein
MLEINAALKIPLNELEFQTARSGGPGGQNVNKLETKVILRFDVAHSPALSEAQRELLLSKLASRLSQEGVLLLSCQEHRSQLANREEVIQRFVSLLQSALKPKRRRIATRPTLASKEERLEHKKQRQQLKSQRSQRNWRKDSGY